MTAHELANKLLQSPDLPIVINGWGSEEGSSFEVSDSITDLLSFNGIGDTKNTPRDDLGYNIPRPCITLDHCERTPISDRQKAERENRKHQMEVDLDTLSEVALNLKYATCRGLTPDDISKMI